MFSVALVISISRTELVVQVKNSNNKGLVLYSSSLISSKTQFAGEVIIEVTFFIFSSSIKLFTILLASFSVYSHLDIDTGFQVQTDTDLGIMMC